LLSQYSHPKTDELAMRFAVIKSLFIIFAFVLQGAVQAEPQWSTSNAEQFQDALMKAGENQSEETDYADPDENENPDFQLPDDIDTCLWGGWISTKNKQGQCQPPYRTGVNNDPYIQGFGPTYNSSMQCGGATLYRCNPVIFGTGTGRDTKGFCVDVATPDPKAMMVACQIASRPSRAMHIQKLSNDPQLLAQYISQAAEISLQCKIANTGCEDFLHDITDEVKPALSCHQQMNLYPHMLTGLSEFNIKMIDELTGSLGSDYGRYLDDLSKRRDQALKHNRQILDQAIANYSSSTQVANMFKNLRTNFTRRHNKYRNYVGPKPAGVSSKRCLMHVKLGLVAGKLFSSYPGTQAAQDFGPNLTRAGFTNLMGMPGMEHITPENAPAGAIIVYRGGDYGHIEVKMDDGNYGSDFVKDAPISAYSSKRRPIGVYVKIPSEIPGMIEVPNE
jgi:hypothetical protein